MEQTIYWEAMKVPSPLALPGLNKLVTTCITNNFLSPTNLVSALKLSKLANVPYNNTLNLLNKPGFVKVEGDVSGWYYLRDLGSEYPASFPNSLKIIRTQIIKSDSIKAASITNVPEADKVLRSQLRAQDLLKPNERILTLTDESNKGKTNKNELTTLFLNMMASIMKSESPPERYATAMYEIAENIHNGTLTVSD